MCKKSTAKLKLIENLIVSPDTPTLWQAQLNNLTKVNQEASGLKK